MVVEPFRQSQLDPHPAADIYVGTLIIVYDDGSTDTAMMFAPWGHFKFDGAYGVANVSRFRDECRKSLLQSSHPDASRLLNDPRLWK